MKAYIFVCILSSAIGCFIYNCGQMSNNTKAVKKKVKECFDSVNWNVQTFTVGDHFIKDTNGNTQFYEKESIDEAIKKLNKVLEDG
jgi:hypothetical protein